MFSVLFCACPLSVLYANLFFSLYASLQIFVFCPTREACSVKASFCFLFSPHLATKGPPSTSFQSILDDETVDYPMGVRQSATILFPDMLENRSEKKLKAPASSGKFIQLH